MRISALQQAPCADRSKITGGIDPGGWIVPGLPAGWRLLSFHFFVDWSQEAHPAVGERVWMTRQLRLDAGERIADIGDEAVLRLFREHRCSGEFEDLERVCAPYGQRVTVILLPEIPVAEIGDETPVWIILRSEGLELQIRSVSVRRLKRAIQEYSGGPVYVGDKGLKFGTSAVECFLSTSEAAFPGDADAVIVDDRNRVRGIVEYKKHTLAEPIGNQLITRYYPRPDGRKYRRLAALAAHYERCLQQPVPLVVLYYSTSGPFIRLQEIGALDADRIEIARDTGDQSIADLSPQAIAEDIKRWLGMY